MGMHGDAMSLLATARGQELLSVVDTLNDDAAVHGILVQMPLPRHMDAEGVIGRIRPDKDVDGFHPINVGKLSIGQADGFIPCTPNGVPHLVEKSGVELR